MTEPTQQYRWRVYLGVRSSALTAEQLTHQMGVPGGRASSASDRRWPYLWELDSGLPAGAELDEHLVALVRRCRERTDQIAALVRRPDCRVTIEAVLHFDAHGEDESLPGMWIPPDVIQFAADCGIGIDIDSYFSRDRHDRPQ